MSELVILVPVLGRPERVQPLMDSIRRAASVQYEVCFLCTSQDKEEVAEAGRSGALYFLQLEEAERGDYSRKINLGYQITEEPWLFLGADDLEFHPGWDEQAISASLKSGRRVVGTNDLGNPLVKRGDHSTHTLVHRSYIEEYGTIDEPGKVLHEGYSHCWTDNEFCETAMFRGEFVSALASHVEHLHYLWGKGSEDETYRKGQEHYRSDQALFLSRRHLWGGGKRGRRL